MGEYAHFMGERIKLGTCEDLFYMRAEHVPLIDVRPGDDDPRGALDVYRFRFPFPDEDGKDPGTFNDHSRAIGIYGVSVPDGVEHGQTQFVSSHGFNVMLPCPESPEGVASGLRFHRNGYAGPVQITGQGVRNGVLALMARCGGCHQTYRYPTLADAADVVEACLKNAEGAARTDDNSRRDYWLAVAHRITDGYTPGAIDYLFRSL